MRQLPNEMVCQIAGILRDASDFLILLERSLVCHVWNDFCRPLTVHTVVVRAQNFYAWLEFLHFTTPSILLNPPSNGTTACSIPPNGSGPVSSNSTLYGSRIAVLLLRRWPRCRLPWVSCLGSPPSCSKLST
ncbi:hypothetical protein BDN71DRAFT_1205607 [Pleurotus eryngii]|uniref:F-box domain-containing protein n=1 Tax=Pleurotus eryngii TaxID=5323 RepID=A0A9P6D4J8_PLEER|nr:hypothetical protein BDN71DRAFT_1205607 [Pleurotus eryngii]